jgi:hypothetical protein
VCTVDTLVRGVVTVDDGGERLKGLLKLTAVCNLNAFWRMLPDRGLDCSEERDRLAIPTLVSMGGSVFE